MGAILLTAVTILGSIVTALILMITLEPMFGSEGNELNSVLPVSPEVLIAVEVLLAGIMFGMLLLDLLGITHITKYYSPDYLSTISKYFKYIFTGIFVIGTLGSAYLLVMGGVIRLESFLSNAQAVSPSEISAQSNDGQIIHMPNGQDSLENLQEQGLSAVEADVHDTPVEYSPQHQNAIAKLFIGTPLVSFCAVLFGAVGLLPFGGMLISGISFIPALVILGPFWAIGHVGVILINRIYDWARNYLDIFIQRADAARNREGASNNNPANNPPPPPPSAAESNSPETSVRSESPQDMANNSPASEQPAAASNSGEPQQGQGENPIYSQNDPNWNPLI